VPLIEIVIPVYNEEAGLAASVCRLRDYLIAAMPFPWRITIANNGSTDRTSDLRALLPLAAPLVSGHSDVAIGTRLAPGARVVRGRKRELISRAYNRLLHATLAARFSDAQCGFKAMRADAARRLLPGVRDEAWFFDTELLMLAQRSGLRIHEVPVDWVDDPDSRVEIVRTALDDLRGIVRLLASARLTRFAFIGLCSTLAYGLLLVALRGPMGVGAANAVALAITAVANTQANRWLTFGVRGRAGLIRQHLAGALVSLLTLGLTVGALGVLHALDQSPSNFVELAVLVVASASATVSRYVALRTWVFARERRPGLVRRTAAAIARVGL
jgi:putative flippase GtrA